VGPDTNHLKYTKWQSITDLTYTWSRALTEEPVVPTCGTVADWLERSASDMECTVFKP